MAVEKVKKQMGAQEKVNQPQPKGLVPIKHDLSCKFDSLDRTGYLNEKKKANMAYVERNSR